MLDPFELLQRVQDARALLEDDDPLEADRLLAELEDELIRAGRN